MVEITAEDQNKGKRMERIEDSLRVLLDNIKCSDIQIIGVPKRNGFQGSSNGKEPSCQCWRHKGHWFNPWVRKIPWRRVKIHKGILRGTSNKCTCGSWSIKNVLTVAFKYWEHNRSLKLWWRASSLLPEGNMMPVLWGNHPEVTPYSLRRRASTFILAKVISVI